ncbi:MAG TPA: hypothetical protein VKT77_08945 [Chthonomonadaceae bacterium]|nr:hypothetical protein [Chthonomonadaceae bacterium]
MNTQSRAEHVETVRRLAQEIRDTTGEARDRAIAELKAIGPDAVPAIQAILGPSFDRNGQSRRKTRTMSWLLGAAIALCFGLMPFSQIAALIELLCCFPVIAWTAAFDIRSVRLLPSEVIAALLLTEETSAIPLLLDVRGLRSTTKYQPVIAARLTKLLPLLTVEDAALIDAEHRQALIVILDLSLRLGGSVHRDFLVAILHAFGNIGCTTAMPSVRRLAKRSWDGAVRQAAIECLERLQARAALPADILLRAAARADNAGDLLRGAAGVSPDRDDELLRADDSDRGSDRES